ncbi:hypothetical protein [Segniliparus rugosus]|uniref:hypothetical protein n=1 Tax=Segniliparus rugosus TaxID=286804 RepID=UPI000687DB79|nr:hypothetical protein [Segniliparus rugosus]
MSTSRNPDEPASGPIPPPRGAEASVRSACPPLSAEKAANPTVNAVAAANTPSAPPMARGREAADAPLAE